MATIWGTCIIAWGTCTFMYVHYTVYLHVCTCTCTYLAVLLHKFGKIVEKRMLLPKEIKLVVSLQTYTRRDAYINTKP